MRSIVARDHRGRSNRGAEFIVGLKGLLFLHKE